MDKKPYFTQFGILFVMLGIICAINAVDKILKTGWLFYAVIIVVVITLVYAIVSSIAIANMKK